MRLPSALRRTPAPVGFHRAHRIDLAVFRSVTGRHTPRLDSVLLPLSRLADKSVLWILFGAALALGGGRFGKRAALRGFVSVCATSLVANGFLKQLARRPRPELLAKARRSINRPASFSFPSGHSASAAAFSTAVAMELPVAAAPVAAVAGGVAYSRIYAGVHYPGDVILGAGLGVAMALATRKVWPLASRRPAVAQAVPHSALAPPCADGEGLTVVVNLAARSAVRASVRKSLAAGLPRARIVHIDSPEDLEKAVEEACRDSFAVAIAGGDGSANAAAAVALRLDKPLLLIPAGTWNHLARDLGISSVEEALEGLHSGTAAAVDTGFVQGRPFLNTASLGVYTEMVDIRESLERRLGKWPAILAALFRVLADSRAIDVQMDGRARKLWMIFVGNCCYRPSGFAPAYRDRLDDGNLDVRIVDASPPWGRTRLLLAVLTGTLARTRVYEEFVTDSLDIKSLQGNMRLARDGETFDSGTAFCIDKIRRRLVVYRPAGKGTRR